MCDVTRINLKTDCEERQNLIDFCLNGKEQFIAIGWSYIYKEKPDIKSYEEYYNAVKEDAGRINHSHNVFFDTNEGDLFWTRDLEGIYWIGRVIGIAENYCDFDMDIGAIIPIKAFKVGIEVPGQIKASFNRPLGGVCQRFQEPIILNYSKYIYNIKSRQEYYSYNKTEGNILENLPDFDLEELIIAYLQIKENYYVLSNSIANKSTTIKVECEMILRDKSILKKAVVQVKGGTTSVIDARDYKVYIDNGYVVYLYAPTILNINDDERYVQITQNDLFEFYREYKKILPDSITNWENMFE